MTGRPALILFSSSEIGGAERSLTRMAMTVQGRDYFDLATLNGEGPWANWARAEGLEPYCWGGRSAGGVHGRWGLATLYRLVRFVREKHYKIVYVVGFRASWVLRFLKPFLRGAQLVLGVRANLSSNSLADRSFRLGERWTSCLIDHYICNSDAARQTLALSSLVPLNKISVIYNGLSILPDHLPVYADRKRHIITIANLNVRKGYLPYLKNVVLPLCQKFYDIRFIFLGRDDMKGEVQSKIQEWGLDAFVAYHGFRTEVSSFLKDSQIFVLPSLWGEGCPTSILEAMAHALPVVAFSIDGIPELIQSGQEGWLVESGQHEEMLRVLEALLQDPEPAHQMGLKGRQKVQASFTLDVMADRHIRLLKEMDIKCAAS